MEKEEFSLRFKNCRKGMELTQEAFLEQFNSKYKRSFTAAAVSQYENGKRLPEVDALIDFADFFSVSLDYLLGLERDMGRNKVISGIVGNRIKELRNIKNLNQDQVAQVLGVSRQAYANYESGKREPDLQTVIKLANYFDVSLDELLKIDDYTVEDKKTVGGRIKLARVAKGLKQSELAEMLGLAASTVALYEQNRREPNLKTVVKLAKCLGLSLDYLLGYDEE